MASKKSRSKGRGERAAGTARSGTRRSTRTSERGTERRSGGAASSWGTGEWATGSGRGEDRGFQRHERAGDAGRRGSRAGDGGRYESRGDEWTTRGEQEESGRERTYGRAEPRSFDQCPTCGQWTIDASHDVRPSSRDEDEGAGSSASHRRGRGFARGARFEGRFADQGRSADVDRFSDRDR